MFTGAPKAHAFIGGLFAYKLTNVITKLDDKGV